MAAHGYSRMLSNGIQHGRSVVVEVVDVIVVYIVVAHIMVTVG